MRKNLAFSTSMTRHASINKLLIDQIYRLQQQLLINSQTDSSAAAVGPGTELSGATNHVKNPTDEILLNMLTDTIRHEAQISAARYISDVSQQGALNIQLGNLVISSTAHPARLLLLPFNLFRFWWENRNSRAARKQHQTGFKKVIKAYQQQGYAGAQQYIESCGLSQAMQANAYTALARHLKNIARQQAAQSARKAYELDPQPFRLKWLAFRLQEAGEAVEAEALLAHLGDALVFSDTEQARLKKLHEEAHHIRCRNARQRLLAGTTGLT